MEDCTAKTLSELSLKYLSVVLEDLVPRVILSTWQSYLFPDESTGDLVADQDCGRYGPAQAP